MHPFLSSHRVEKASNLCQTAGAGVWAIVYLFGACVGAAVAVANYTKSPQTNNPTTPRTLDRAKAEDLAEGEMDIYLVDHHQTEPKRLSTEEKTHDEREERAKGEEREEDKISTSY